MEEELIEVGGGGGIYIQEEGSALSVLYSGSVRARGRTTRRQSGNRVLVMSCLIAEALIDKMQHITALILKETQLIILFIRNYTHMTMRSKNGQRGLFYHSDEMKCNILLSAPLAGLITLAIKTGFICCIQYHELVV